MRQCLLSLIMFFLVAEAGLVWAQAQTTFDEHDMGKLIAFLKQPGESFGNAAALGLPTTEAGLRNLTKTSWQSKGIVWDNTSPNVKLKTFDFYKKGLTGDLDFSGCTGLQTLNCQRNNLTSAKVDNCPVLKDFRCHVNLQLTSLSVEGCPKLGNTAVYLDSCSLNFDQVAKARNKYIETEGTKYYLQFKYRDQDHWAPDSVFKGSTVDLNYLLATTEPLTYTVKYSIDGNPDVFYKKWTEGNFSDGIFTLPADYVGELQIGIWCDSWNVVGVDDFDERHPVILYSLTTYTYVATFDTQGGSDVDPINADNDNKITQPADPTRYGYRFLGWYDAEEGGSKWKFDEPVSGDVTIYAQWIELAKATFDTQGGSAIDSVYVDDSDMIMQPADPTRSGYRFLGWYDAEEEGNKWDFDESISNDVTIYAQWIEVIQVAFDTQGGSTIDTVSIDCGDKITQPADPTRSGYRFLGWYDAEEGGNEWNFDESISNDVTIYAQWIEVIQVAFDTQGGGNEPPMQIIDLGSTVAEPQAPQRNGYAFLGWYTEAEGGSMWVLGEEGTIVTDDITLYAQWILDLGGSLVSNNELPKYYYEGEAITPEVTLYYEGEELEEGVDYTLKYEDNNAVGTGSIVLSGEGRFGGTRVITFTIQEQVFSYVTISEVEGVTTTPSAGRHIMKEGTKYTITITVAEGYTLADIIVLMNGKQIYPIVDEALRASQETLTIEFVASSEDCVIEIRYVTPTGIGVIADALRISGEAGAIRIDSSTAETASIFDFAGRMIYNQRIEAGSILIPVKRGMYIVTVGKAVQKLLIND